MGGKLEALIYVIIWPALVLSTIFFILDGNLFAFATGAGALAFGYTIVNKLGD